MLNSAFDLDAVVEDTSYPSDESIDLALLGQECQARARIYRVLAGVFVEEPSVEFLATMGNVDWLRSLEQVGVKFGADFLDTELTTLANVLACEYATLFASSGGFPPVESVRLTGRFKQDPHYQVTALYKRLGFAQVKGRFDVFADQLGMELMFVAEMLDRCAEAVNNDDFAAYKRLDKEIKRFWSLHLGRWVRGYSSLITRAANHSFYREMARFLNGFAIEEIAAMGLTKLDDLDQGQLVIPKSEITLEFNPDEPVCGECPSGLTDRMEAPGKLRVIPITPVSDLSF
jgi:TorA maturation chaperone TorD